MSTEVLKKIDPDNSSGTHYTSLFAWEAAFGGTTAGDLVGENKNVVAELYCTNGTADATAVDISGWTATSATNNIRITVKTGYRHRGVVPGSGNIYRLVVTSGGFAIKVQEDYVTVQYVAAKMTATANYNSCLYFRAVQGCKFEECVSEVVPGAYSSIRCFNDYACTTGTNIFRNCLALGATTGTGVAFWSQNRSGGTIYYDHCGAPEGVLGISSTGNSGCSVIARNCYCFTSSTSFANTTAGTDRCGYKTGGAAPNDSNPVDLSGEANTDLWIAPGSDNYRVKRSGVLYGAAANLYSDANDPVTTDILGWPRPSTGAVDLGPFEAAEATGASTLTALTATGVAEIEGIGGITYEATGAATLSAITASGTVSRHLVITGGFTVPLPLAAGSAISDQVVDMPSASLHGYETFPLDPEFALVETWVYRTIATEPLSDTTQTRSIRPRPLRRWRLRWTLAKQTEAEIIRGFYRDMRGGALPFWLEAPDKIARPFDNPAVAAISGGSQADRTVYAVYTWTRGVLETLPSYQTATLALLDAQLLTVTVPEFPANVTGATVYVGPTEELLYAQDSPIAVSGGTWTEPQAGYSDAGAAPPTANTLTETVLVHFGEQGLRVLRRAHDQYEIEVMVEELWIENPRAHFISGGFTVPASLLGGTVAMHDFSASGAATIPAITASGTAEREAGTVHTITGGFSVPVPDLEGDLTPVLLGDYYVAKTGSNSNPGTYALPFLTITYAISVAAAGSTIIVLAGTYTETVNVTKSLTFTASGTVIVNPSTTYGFYNSGGTADTVTIDGFSITGVGTGVYSVANDAWTVTNCRVYDCTSGGIYLTGTRASGVNTAGIGCSVTGNVVYRIGITDDVCGIKLDSCKNSTVSDNQVYLCVADGIRDIRGDNNDTTENYVSCCNAGIGVANETKGATVQSNYVYHCNDGVYTKATTGSTSVYNVISYNTMDWCCAALNCGADYPGANYFNAHHNLFKFSGDQHVYYNPSAIGTNVVIDYNMYWSRSDRPTCFWDNVSATFCTVNDIQHETTREDHGVEYDADTVGNYGAATTICTEPEWTPIDFVPEAASHNFSILYRLCDWKYDLTWNSGTGYATNEYVTFDLESSQEFEYVLMLTWGNNVEHTPKNMKVQTSPDGSSWTDRVTVTNTWGGGVKWYRFAAPVTARYVKLVLTDKFTTDSYAWTYNEFKIASVAVGNLI